MHKVSRPVDDSDQDTCVCCLEVKPRQNLDRMLWCAECNKVARGRAASRGWLVGVLVAGVLSSWIWLFIQPSNLVIGGWVGTVLAAFYVSARVAREVLYAVARMQSRPVAEPVPPERCPD